MVAEIILLKLGRHTYLILARKRYAFYGYWRILYHFTVIYPPLNVIRVIPEEDIDYNRKIFFTFTFVVYLYLVTPEILTARYICCCLSNLAEGTE